MNITAIKQINDSWCLSRDTTSGASNYDPHDHLSILFLWRFWYVHCWQGNIRLVTVFNISYPSVFNLLMALTLKKKKLRWNSCSASCLMSDSSPCRCSPYAKLQPKGLRTSAARLSTIELSAPAFPRSLSFWFCCRRPEFPLQYSRCTVDNLLLWIQHPA